MTAVVLLVVRITIGSIVDNRKKKMRDRNQQSKSEIAAENTKDRAKPREHEEQRQDSTQN